MSKKRLKFKRKFIFSKQKKIEKHNSNECCAIGVSMNRTREEGRLMISGSESSERKTVFAKIIFY